MSRIVVKYQDGARFEYDSFETKETYTATGMTEMVKGCADMWYREIKYLVEKDELFDLDVI